MSDTVKSPAGQLTLAAAREVVDNLSKVLDALPGPMKKRVERDLSRLKELVLEQRLPRLLIVGRRGAGKSSLINAIFGSSMAGIGPVRAHTGKGTWYTYSTDQGDLRILDTRGFGEGTRPEGAEHATAEKEIAEAIAGEAPDAILFLCKAKEIDARIDEDIRSLLEVHRTIAAKHQYASPIVGLVTQVDELDPVRIGPPFDHPQKMANIEEACATLAQAFADAGHRAEKILPIATYLEFENGRVVDSRIWNVDKLLEYLVEVLPRNAQLIMARTTRVKTVQKRIAREIVGVATSLCAGLAAVPIPLADTIPLTAIQVGMISGIGYLSGRDMSKQTAVEFISAMGLNVGAGLAFRELARGLIKLIPGAGSIISAAVAGAGTWALGQAAILYFLEGKSAAEAKDHFERTRHKNPPDLPPEPPHESAPQ